MEAKNDPYPEHLIAHPDVDRSGYTYLREPGDQSPAIIDNLTPDLAEEVATRWNTHYPTRAALAAAEEEIKKLREVLADALGCFEAAETEGFTQYLHDGRPGEALDIYTRRLLYAHINLKGALLSPEKANEQLNDQGR